MGNREGNGGDVVREDQRGRGERERPQATDSKERKDFDKCLQDFAERLAHVEVLDPACGSGNFLYVALNLLLELEREVLAYADIHGLTLFPGIRPTQLHGLEINTYAAELAQVVIWIGFLQWMHFHGYVTPRNPVLQSFESIIQQDSIIDLSDPENPKETEWPAAEFIVGNPPFLGDKKMRAELSDNYVEAVRRLYEGRLPGQSDLCCYWFEKSRAMIEARRAKRAGLIATQGIRGGANRICLERIKQTGDIFFAFADRDWILDGATVHVSMVGFDGGHEKAKSLDGVTVDAIHADLRAGNRADVTKAKLIPANAAKCFLGVMKAGSFDISETVALEWLNTPNPHGKPNSDVLRPRLTARDILQRAAIGWIVDFGCDSVPEAMMLYKAPWKHVETVVKPKRDTNRNSA